MSKFTIGQTVKIIDANHPHFGETGTVQEYSTMGSTYVRRAEASAWYTDKQLGLVVSETGPSAAVLEAAKAAGLQRGDSFTYVNESDLVQWKQAVAENKTTLGFEEWAEANRPLTEKETHHISKVLFTLWLWFDLDPAENDKNINLWTGELATAIQKLRSEK